MKKLVVLSSVLILCITACNLPSQAPEKTTLPVEIPSTNIPVTATLKSSTTPTPTPPVPIVYYYFVDVPAQKPPAGSVVILPEILVLAPLFSKTMRMPDIAANLTAAIQAVIKDSRNAWTSNGLTLASASFNGQRASIALQGEYFAPGDIVLMAARMQLLLTVFAEPMVQSALITINGKNIANLGISHSSEAKPDDYAFTRVEIDAFKVNNASK